MPDNPAINSDISPEDSFTPQQIESSFGDVVTPTDIPASDVDQQSDLSSIAAESFKEEERDNSSVDGFFEGNPIERDEKQFAPGRKQLLKSSMLALSRADLSKTNPILAMGEENLQAMQDALDASQEFSLRLGIAAKRQQDTLFAIENQRKIGQQLARDKNPAREELDQAFEKAYRETIQAQTEKDAEIALELETVERVKDALTQGDPVEARLIIDQFVNDRTATNVVLEQAAKQMIVAQRLEEFQSELDDQWFLEKTFNFLTGFIPVKGNFARSGVLEDAGIETPEVGFFDFLFSGDNLEKQGQVLFDLPLAEFAQALAPNGEVVKSIRDNASFILEDPSLQLAILDAMQNLTEGEKTFENVLGAADVALTVPVLKIGKGLSRLGARKAEVGRTAQAIEAHIKKGPEAAEASTGMRQRDVVEALEPKDFNPSSSGVSIGGDVSDELALAEELRKMLPEIHQTRALDEDELIAAIETEEKALRDKYGSSIKDVRRLQEDVNSGVLYDFNGSLNDQNQKVFVVETVVGRKNGAGGYANERTAKGALTRFGIKDVQTEGKKVGSGKSNSKTDIEIIDPSDPAATIKDLEKQGYKVSRFNTKKGHVIRGEKKTGKIEVETKIDPRKPSVFKAEDGQWYGKFQTHVKEDGFVTSTLQTPEGVPLSYFRSSARTSDPTAIGKALVAGNASNNFIKNLNKVITKSLKGISNGDKKAIDQVIRLGQNEKKWFSRDEFMANYERHYGKIPDEKIYDAYRTYRAVSDLTYLSRNANMYQIKAQKGFKNVEFKIGDLEYNMNGKVTTDPNRKTLDRAYDVSRNRWIDKGITNDEITRMSREGYVRVTLDDVIKMPNGESTRTLMIKNEELTQGLLRRDQLQYQAGGSRAYKGKYFAKQATTDRKGNLLPPSTFRNSVNRNGLREWADDMNEAINLAKRGETDPTLFDDIFRARKGYPSGEEFLRLVDEGRIDLNNDIEVVFDGEMPSNYKLANDENLRFVDTDDTDLEAFYRDSGQMFYSKRGEALLDDTGEFAETVDPWNTLNKSVNEIARVQSFSGYKQHVLERFKNTYGSAVRVADLKSDSLYEYVNAPLKPSVQGSALGRKVKQEQDAIRNVLGFETAFEKNLKSYDRSIAEWVVGDAKGGPRAFLGEKILNLRESNPVTFLRGFAFDSKLGLFNIGQFFIQTSTMAAATALSPKHGLRGMAVTVPLHAWHLGGKSANTLDLLAKRGVWKAGGFESEQAFKQFAKTLDDSGILEVGSSNLAQLQDFKPQAVFGASSKIEAVREGGRAFFYAAEQYNRITAARIAWGEALEQGLKPGSQAFKDEFVRLSDDYSFNMMSQSGANFQRGLTSIPTQFWAYGFRMMDNMLGKRFTPAQKTRLIAQQFLFAGAAGVPVGGLVADIYERYNGEPADINEIDSMFVRGFADKAIWELTGANVEIGAKIGTADMLNNIIRDIFGIGEYGERSVADMMAGATGSITMSATGSLYDVVKYGFAESGGKMPEGYGMTEDSIVKLMKEISTFGNAHKAYMAYNYGVYKSKQGTIIAAGLPEQNAIFNVLGFQPGEASDVSFYFDPAGDKETVKEAAKLITNWRQEAFTIPDKYEENMKKVNAYTQMLPPHLKGEVARKVRETTDPSLYDGIRRRWEEKQKEREQIEHLHERNLENNAQ